MTGPAVDHPSGAGRRPPEPQRRGMKIEAVDFFYVSMPEVTTDADGSQDALVVRVAAGGLLGWGECEASPRSRSPPSSVRCRTVPAARSPRRCSASRSTRRPTSPASPRPSPATLETSGSAPGPPVLNHLPPSHKILASGLPRRLPQEIQLRRRAANSLKSWCPRSDSNQQPTVYKTVALPIELQGRGDRVTLPTG